MEIELMIIVYHLDDDETIVGYASFVLFMPWFSLCRTYDIDVCLINIEFFLCFNLRNLLIRWISKEGMYYETTF